MHVLLTGAGGYIGRRILEALIDRGHAVTAVVRPGRPRPAGARAMIEADLADTATLTAAAVSADAIAHTAFDLTEGLAAACAKEAALVRAWCRVLAGSSRRLVVTNGAGFYGDLPETWVEEGTPPVATDPTSARATATGPATATPGVSGVELRLAPFVYGEAGSAFLPVLVAAAQRHRRAIYVGAGENRFSGVHVCDVAAAFVAALELPQASGVYHVAADDAPRARDLADALGIGQGVPSQSASPAEAEAEVGPFIARFLMANNLLSSRRIRTELDWQPRASPGLLWDLAEGSYRVQRAPERSRVSP